MRIIRAVNTDKPKNERRRPVNLTLSRAVIRQGSRLVKDTHRGSFSNLVEWLIVEKAAEVGVIKAAEKSAKEQAA